MRFVHKTNLYICLRVIQKPPSFHLDKSHLLQWRYMSMASRLTLTVLVDNATIGDHDYCGEAGLSFFLETAGKEDPLLYRTCRGSSSLMRRRWVSIFGQLDTLVFSHGHIVIIREDWPLYLSVTLRCNSRTGKPPRLPRLIAHPRCFWQKEKDSRKNGSPMNEGEVIRQFPEPCRKNRSGLPMIWFSWGRSRGGLLSSREIREPGDSPA